MTCLSEQDNRTWIVSWRIRPVRSAVESFSLNLNERVSSMNRKASSNAYEQIEQYKRGDYLVLDPIVSVIESMLFVNVDRGNSFHCPSSVILWTTEEKERKGCRRMDHLNLKSRASTYIVRTFFGVLYRHRLLEWLLLLMLMLMLLLLRKDSRCRGLGDRCLLFISSLFVGFIRCWMHHLRELRVIVEAESRLLMRWESTVGRLF